MTEKNNVPEGFTLSMAFMDLLPVIFFSIGVIVLADRFGSTLFIIGACLIVVSGLMKVLWKFILGIAKKDIGFFNRQLHYLMPVGFVVCLISLFVDRSRWSFMTVVHHIFSMPAAVFFILMIVFMVLMFYLGRHNDTRDAHANWIEQGTNALFQISFMLVVIL